ncbi:hypothetical protein ACNIU6_19750, partial [Escherichia coli]
DRNRSHWSTSKTPSYTKSVSWQHHPHSDELPRNKHASHIEIFAKIVHEIIFSLPIRDINIHQYHNISQH